MIIRHFLATLMGVLTIPAFVMSQNLKPFIGTGTLPANQDSVCPIPVYKGSYENSGYFKNETVADFTLYTLSGNPVNLLAELQKKKPVLLVNGNYTCPVFRGKISELNAIYNTYKDDLSIYVVYTVEAHPDQDPSPYSGTVWVTSQNTQAGILYRQPRTYGERKQLVQTMVNNISPAVLPEILIDGPCNNWWANFGPAPNNAYLIDTNGVVFAKQGWFNKAPNNMSLSIDTLLGRTSGGGGGDVTKGLFSFALKGGNRVTGAPGNVLNLYGTIRNTSPNPVHIDIIRMVNNIPSDWGSAMCTDVCLSTETDTTDLYLNAYDSATYTMYFYTGQGAFDSGAVQIGFINKYNFSNKRSQVFYGYTDNSLGIISAESGKNNHKIFPNPVAAGMKFNLDFGGKEIFGVKLFDMRGMIVFEENNPEGRLKGVEGVVLPGGIYIYEISGKDMTARGKLIFE